MILCQYKYSGELIVFAKMAKLATMNVIKEYLETNTSLLGKDLEKGAGSIFVFIKLGMVKKDDADFERSRIRIIQKICIKDNSVTFAAKRMSLVSPSSARPSITRMETPVEKLRRLLEQH